MAESSEKSAVKSTSHASSLDPKALLKFDRASVETGSPHSDDDIRSSFANASRPITSPAAAPRASALGLNSSNPDSSTAHTNAVNRASSSSLASGRVPDKFLNAVAVKDETATKSGEVAFSSSVGSARGGCGCAGGRNDGGTAELLALGISLLALAVATGLIDLNGNNGNGNGKKKRKRGEVNQESHADAQTLRKV